MLSAQHLRYKLIGFAIAGIGLISNSVSAQIYSDQDEQQLIPGTQNITPGPGIDLSNWNTTGHSLQYATIQNTDLTGASFNSSNLASSNLIGSTLVDADFSNAILSNSELMNTNVTGANFAGAAIDGVYFGYDTGFTAAQLYSTSTYQGTNLNLGLEGLDLTGWNFANKNISKMDLIGANITNVDFTGAIIVGSGTYTYGTLFTSGLTAAQLYSTASYQNRDLAGAQLGGINMTGWNLANQNLSGSNFEGANLTNADLSNSNFDGAFMVGANFTNTNFTGVELSNVLIESSTFTASELYSTVDYQNHNISTITLQDDNLAGCSFVNQTVYDLSGSILTNADFTGATVQGAHFSANVGFTASQLYSTASYQSHVLSYIWLHNLDMTGWNFANQNLLYADFEKSNLTGANFAGANLSYTDFFETTLLNANFTNAQFRDTAFNDTDLRGSIEWSPVAGTVHDTIYPDGSLPGLTMTADELLTIRNDSIPIIVTAAATFNATSTLQFFLDGDWTSTTSFSAGIVPSLAGTLDLELADVVNPTTLIGDTFQLFVWNGTLPVGDQFNVITTAPGYIWDTSQLYTGGTVTLLAVPEPNGAIFLAAAGVGFASRRRR